MNANTQSDGGRFDVDIAFPCYNTAQWIDGFIEDLLKYNGARWRLIARDDGSSDDSHAVLKKWRERLGPRMMLLDADGSSPNLGLIANFNAVLGAAAAPSILTADPDDRWLPNRIDLTLAALKAAEAESGADTPVAVFTDAEVVDADGVTVAPSYWRWARNLPPARYTIPRTSMDCAVLGSTMAVNRALLRAALPMPACAGYQDWWMVLVAVALGRLVVLPEVTIRYLRHGANATKDPYSASLGRMIVKLATAPSTARKRLDYLIGQAARQADGFVAAYGDRLSASDAEALRALARLPGLDPLQRRLAVVRHGLWFNSTIKNVGLLAFV